ncbi:MAG: chain length determinant protein tyrosine kinase EpsG [Rhizobacter sp.]|nr:chain length determinant protein tyrosine kinase EpsG [Rhizobacter sp.]
MKMSGPTSVSLPPAVRSIGAILIDAGLLRPEDAERILLLQRQENLRFGEAAIRLGLLTEADMQYALARQFSFPFLRATGGRKPVSDELVAAYQPFSATGERLRVIRNQIMLRWIDKAEQRNAFAMVGAEQGEGRTYLAANLAVVFAQLGERTLLIDGNLRTPRVHDLFMLQNKVGFSTYLAGRSRDESIIRITDLAGLFVLPAGPVPPNPLELLSRQNFDDLLAQSRSRYDIVIIDTPGLSEGEEGAMIAMRAGAAVAVARQGQTSIRMFSHMVRELTNAGVAVIGSVLNDIPAKKKGAT